MPFRLASSALDSNGLLPPWYARTGSNSSPPVGWAEAPRGTESIAVICEEPDSPFPSRWVVYNLPPEPSALSGGQPLEPDLPCGASQGVNSLGVPGWSGPDEDGTPKRFRFEGFALSSMLDIPSGSDLETVRTAMEGRILARAVLEAGYAPRGERVRRDGGRG